MNSAKDAIQEYKQSYQTPDAVKRYENQILATSTRDRWSIRGLISLLVVKAEQSALRRVMNVIPAGGSIIDIPCGTGKEFSVLQGRGRVIGADSSMAMLRTYVQRGGLEVIRADVSLLP